MKMADGGWRPAYNAQLATDTASQVIVGLDLTPIGNDQGQLGRWFASSGDVTAVHLAPGSPTPASWPTQRSRSSPNPPAARPYTCQSALPRIRAATRICRSRPTHRACLLAHPMSTPQAKEIYKDRAATAECVNAIARNRGLQRFRVRGQAKARAVLLWFALAHNLMRTVALRSAAATI